MLDTGSKDMMLFRLLRLSGVFNSLFEEHGRSDLNVISVCAPSTCGTVIAVCGNVMVRSEMC